MDDSNDVVRSPDGVKRERLLNKNVYDELEYALETSKNEFKLIQEKEEEELNELIYQINKKRKTQFITIKEKINKLCLIDKLNIQIYNNILSIIQLYEEGLIDCYFSDKEEVYKYFSILKTIRLTNEELTCLKELIVEK
jgi:hypothetical protein